MIVEMSTVMDDVNKSYIGLVKYKKKIQKKIQIKIQKKIQKKI